MKYFLLITIIIFSGCSKENWPEYYYEVTGTGPSFDITLEGSPSGTAQYTGVTSGWKYTWKQTGTRWLYVAAQNNGSSGSVTVKIVRKGKVMATQTSSGAFVIATVSGDY